MNPTLSLLSILSTVSIASAVAAGQLNITCTVSDKRVSIDIPVPSEGWEALDVVQDYNILNLNWSTSTSSQFYNCQSDSDCVLDTKFKDIGSELDAAALYTQTPPEGTQFVRYVSPELVSSFNGNNNATFSIIIEFNSDGEGKSDDVEDDMEINPSDFYFKRIHGIDLS